ncbi:MAG: dockerin type I repeat-containing protein [Clostridia bacterium]|nr:dockerin type I repeat-containing protein [Clostridia bacterium]
MKKLISVLLTLCLMLPLVAVIPASAASFVGTFFPNGIAKPERPIAYYTWHNDMNNLDDWWMCDFYLYQVTPESVNNFLMEDLIIESNGGNLSDEYGLYWWNSLVQIDMRVDNGQWMSAGEDGAWDLPEAYSRVTLGTRIGYSSSNLFWFADTNFDLYDFLQPGMVVGREYNNDGELIERAYFDFDNHSISFRTRYAVNYYEVKDEAEPQVILSPWSDVTTVGKNGNNVVPELPDELDAPVISDLREGPEEEYSVKFFFDNVLPESTYPTEIASYIGGYGDLGGFEVQIRINGGEWFEADVVNGGWYTAGVREVWFGKDNVPYNPGDKIELRAKITGNSYYEEGSPWSNVISIAGDHVKPYISLSGDGWAKNGDDISWTWESNAVPESLSLEVSETGEEGSWTTLKSIGPDAEFTVDYKSEYKDSGRYFRVKGVFEGDEVVYSQAYWTEWSNYPYFTVYPQGATVPSGQSYTVTWDVDREHVSAWLEEYDTDAEDWRTVREDLPKSFTLDGKYDQVGEYRVWVSFDGYEPIDASFAVTWSGYYFVGQPEGASVRIGYENGTAWELSHAPDSIQIMREENEDWVVDAELTALVDPNINNDSITVHNDGWDGSLHLKVVAWYGDTAVESDDFYLGWYYMKGDFDDDQQITVADALRALRIAAKLVQCTNSYLKIGDIDGDQEITVADALKILRVAAKLADYNSLIA